MGRILAIDFGIKRCGIAETDPTQTIASGLKTIKSKDVLDFIRDYKINNDIDTIVIGLPKNLDCSDTDATKPALACANKIKKVFTQVRVDFVDERFTSKLAARTLFDAGLKKKKRQKKELLDKVSATLILQTYLPD